MNALNDVADEDVIDVPTLLRNAREQRGEEIAEVADILRIRRTYLESIEAGDFNSLPGNAYTLGFIRTYSEHLGLDGEEIVRRFKAQPQGIEAKSELTFPTFVPQHGIPGMAVILIGLIIAGGGYGAWYFVSQGDRFNTEVVQPVPSSLSTPAQSSEANSPPPIPAPSVEITAVAETPAPESTQPTDNAPVPEAVPAPSSPAITPAVVPMAEPVVESSNEEAPKQPTESPEQTTVTVSEPVPTPEPKPGESMAAVLPAPPTAQIPDETPPTPDQAGLDDVGPSRIPAAPETTVETPTAVPVTDPPAPTANAVGNNDAARIIVNAKVDSWIQIRDDEADELVMTRLLRRGESYDVPARSGLTLLTGNAGGLEITVDGRSIPALGPVGAVRRHVALDAEKLQNGTAVLE